MSSAVGAGKPGAGAAPAPAACLYPYLQQPPNHHSQVAPTPPVRDSSSLRGVRVGPGHEKFPSWPGSAESEAPEGGRPAPGGGSHRSKSWTDHTNYPKERAPPYCRPYMKRPSPAYTQQLKTVMERCEKIPPETFLPRDYAARPDVDYRACPELDYGGHPELDYGAPSPPERDKPDPYDHQFQTAEKLSSPGRLTQRDLEEYARAYGEGPPAGYAPSEGYHSYVSGSDCSTNTPFLDRLRRDSAARPQAAPWDEPPERDSGGSRSVGRCDSVVTTSSGSASSSETLKWHGSLSDVSVASSAPPPPQPPLPARHQQLIVAHSARVQTPQRHHSESVLYLGNTNNSNKLRLFPVSTYTVQPGEQQPSPTGSPQQPPSPPHRSVSLSSPTQTQLSVAERISELERQQQQMRYTYLDPEKRHRVSDPTLKAIQKKALLSFYERHHAQPAAAARSQVWRSEPQLAHAPPPMQPSGHHSPPPPQPPPRPRTTSVHSSRRASSASDYAGGAWREIASTREIIINESGNLKDGPRHQHSSSCGSLSTDLLGPLIVGPSISVDDWVPERPPKKPHLRASFPHPLHDRLPSPDLPPPSPPPTAEDEVFASDEPLPPPPSDLPPVEGSPLPSPTKLQDRVPSDCVNKLQHTSTDSEQVRIPERSSKPLPPCNCHVNSNKQWENRNNHIDCNSSCQTRFVDSSSAQLIAGDTYNGSELLKQSDGDINSRNCMSCGVSLINSSNNHCYLQNGHSPEKYFGPTSQQLTDNYNFRSRFQDNYRSQRYSEHPLRQQSSTSSLPRCAESQWVTHRHSECANSKVNENARHSDTFHRYTDRGYPSQRYSSDGNTTLPRTHEYRYSNARNCGGPATVCNVQPDTSNIQRNYPNMCHSQDVSHKLSTRHNSDNTLQKFSNESTVTNHKSDNTADINPECHCSNQKLSDSLIHQPKTLSVDDTKEKASDNISQKINTRISPYKVDKEVVPEKHVRSNSIGNKSFDNDSLLQKIANNRLLKSSENISSLQKMLPASSYNVNNTVGDPSYQTSRTQEHDTPYQNRSDLDKQGHFEREYHEHSISRTAETKHLTSSRSFDNGTQQRHRHDQNNISQKSFDGSGLTQTNGDSNTQLYKYPNTRNTVSSSHQNSTTNTPVYRNSSRMFSRPQVLKPFEINCQNESERNLSLNSGGRDIASDVRASMRCSTQKLVVNGKLATPFQSKRPNSERISGTVSMPAKARLQRLPLSLPSHSQDSATSQPSVIHGNEEKELPAPPSDERVSPPAETSSSKAAYLAYRRERCLPSFEGSYKRTMSPADLSAAPECDRLGMPERALEEESAAEGASAAGLLSVAPDNESSPVSGLTPPETRDGIPPDTGPPPDRGSHETSCSSRDSGVEEYEDCVSHTSSEKVGEEEESNEPATGSNLEDSATESTRSETESQQGIGTGPVVTEQLQLVQRSEVVLRVNAATSDAASQTETEVEEPPARAQLSPEPLPQDQPQQAWPPARRKFQEEIECEQLSLDLASKLPPTDKLQGLLVPDPDHKKPTDYVSDLFRIDVTLRPRGTTALLRSQTNQRNSTGDNSDESCEEHSALPSSSSSSHTQPPSEGTSKDNNSNPASPLPATSAYFTTSESKAKFLTQYGHDMSQLNGLNDNKELHQKKEELMLRLDRKLEVLRGEHLVVREESRMNDELGETVAAQVSRLARPHEAAKYRLHVEEVGKITSLLLGLSGRLARAENALMGLPDNHADRKILESKRDKLIEQLEEAKKLKESIDRRSVSVSNILNKYFNPEEYADYDHFINMKAKLIMDSKEIDDKIKLGEEQLAALRETLSVPE